MKTGSRRIQRGGAWKSSLSPRSRQPSWRRIPARRPRCRSGSSPSRRLRGIESVRSKTRPWNWKQNLSSPTAAVSAPRASRSPVTLSGKDHIYSLLGTTCLQQVQIQWTLWTFSIYLYTLYNIYIYTHIVLQCIYIYIHCNIYIYIYIC